MTTNAICVWDFTYHLCGDKWDDHLEVIGLLKHFCKKYTFQLEKCPTTGNLHYQGRFSLGVKKRKNELVKMLNDMEWVNVAISPTSDANRDNNFYVTKSDSSVLGPWCEKDLQIYIPRQFREVIAMGLHPWQQTIQDDVGVWNTRTINIIFDQQGCIGKSSITGILGCQYLARSMPPMNDYKDIMRMVMDVPTSKMYLIDMPRAINQTKVDGLYAAIEEVKNGHAWDDRYSFKEKWFDCPNIWVFCNRLPGIHLLSKDRWKVWQVVDKNLVHMPTELLNTSPKPSGTDSSSARTLIDSCFAAKDLIDVELDFNI